MKAVVVLCLLFGMSSCAPGAGKSSDPAPAEPTAAAGGEDEIVCREERSTGSMISTKVCRRKSDAAGQQLDNMTRRGGQNIAR